LTLSQVQSQLGAPYRGNTNHTFAQQMMSWGLGEEGCTTQSSRCDGSSRQRERSRLSFLPPSSRAESLPFQSRSCRFRNHR